MMVLACKDVRPSIYGLLVEAKTAIERHKTEVLMMYQAASGQARLKVDCNSVKPSSRFSAPMSVGPSGDTRRGGRMGARVSGVTGDFSIVTSCIRRSEMSY